MACRVAWPAVALLLVLLLLLLLLPGKIDPFLNDYLLPSRTRIRWARIQVETPYHVLTPTNPIFALSRRMSPAIICESQAFRLAWGLHLSQSTMHDAWHKEWISISKRRPSEFPNVVADNEVHPKSEVNAREIVLNSLRWEGRSPGH
ncbi:predicted protein [Verticillium alfalfae VaMs.102]|uniref:Predicted protein n=1 Tax=Verticillium alfalfae (strain VaMs.102 / ATCC MYA-4576 / FGSC 10136) TaxID=526221 RepID=C9SDX8_VERA1|nr:predicted protein [Verticillium alfalfae VaMs.102]EEY16464.1 predicted protein [Verticillium alfalfae VaMs.102]